MGPHPNGRGKSLACCFALLNPFSLQWGRILTDAESRLAQFRIHAGILASMGPHPNGRGKLAMITVIVVFWAMLQWGRILTDAERELP